jgi:hypothetical protein
MCGFYNVWVCVCVGFVMCGCVCGGRDVLIYVYLYLLCFVQFVLCFIPFRLCIFILICFVCTSVRITVTE